MADKTWTQTDGNLASTAANWDGGVAPVAGDNIIFDGTSTVDCTWDLDTDSFGTFTIAAGYTLTIDNPDLVYSSTKHPLTRTLKTLNTGLASPISNWIKKLSGVIE